MTRSHNTRARADAKRRRKDRARRRKDNTYQARASGCPHPRKTRYPDEQTATEAMWGIWRKPTHSGHLPSRVYHCKCGSWHMTSNQPANRKAHQ